MKYNKLMTLLPFMAMMGAAANGSDANVPSSDLGFMGRHSVGSTAGIPASAYYQKTSSYKGKVNRQKFSKRAKLKRRKSK